MKHLNGAKICGRKDLPQFSAYSYSSVRSMKRILDLVNDAVTKELVYSVKSFSIS